MSAPCPGSSLSNKDRSKELVTLLKKPPTSAGGTAVFALVAGDGDAHDIEELILAQRHFQTEPMTEKGDFIRLSRSLGIVSFLRNVRFS